MKTIQFRRNLRRKRLPICLNVLDPQLVALQENGALSVHKADKRRRGRLAEVMAFKDETLSHQLGTEHCIDLLKIHDM